mmetsp:Transcript_19809/g.28487  ORF Transcript_19809/g.28487 Transcript_19809/m.28487 type:complete len:114 (+) Transcript_19809:125-466(+)
MLRFRALSIGVNIRRVASKQIQTATPVITSHSSILSSLSYTGISLPGSSVIRSKISGALVSFISESILFLKRTFQPSLIRRKRKHGFLTRNSTRNGKKILYRRRTKQRRYVSV